MTGIAWRNLVHERTRLAISVGGVAVAVLLILLLQGLYTGVSEQASRYLRSVDADVWVGQVSTRGGFGHSVSVLRASDIDELRRVDGVAAAAPLLGRQVVLTTPGGGETDVFLMGFDTSSQIGGPPARSRGSIRPGSGEIVLDSVFAREHGLDVGDDVAIGPKQLRVSGIGSGGNSLITQYAWATIDDVAQLAGTPGIVSYFVVRGQPSIDAAALARRIEAGVDEVVATTADDFIAESTADIRESFLPILFVLVAIALVVGTTVIGLTIYTAVLEKRGEYGVLKAIGLSNRQLLGIVWRQSLVAGMLGLAVGLVLTVVVAAAIERALPSFAVSLTPASVLLVGAAAAVMGAAAGFVPVRRVTTLDPAAVFRV